ncbi:DNA polymerase beta-like [Amblyomma americanum]|uniref:DNA polymerase n=1 Tax=Amblyomma americanum TaxID=6943 RepID=A0AAQ4E300_AMBAM
MGKKKWSETGKPNGDICEFLNELADYEKNITRNIYKSNAYRKAAVTLEKLDKRVASAEEAKALPGIGAKISQKIAEFLRTGKVSKLEKVRSDESTSAIQELTRVSGIGPAHAKSLYDRGIRSVDELRQNQDALTEHQKIGLRHLEDFEKRIPREEVALLEARVVDELNQFDEDYQAVACGSYRRGLPTSGDIDVLVCHKSYRSTDKRPPKLLARLVEHLRQAGLVTDVMSLGETKFAGVCQLDASRPHRRIDIRVLPQDQFFCGLLYFTGSDLFNQSMRAHAIQQNMTLSEYALRPIGCTGVPGEPLPVSSERDVFDWLGLPYWEPDKRNGPLKP